MADIFYGMDRGDKQEDITTGSSSPTKDIEIVVDDAVGWKKSELIQALDKLKNHIVEQDDMI